MNWTLIGLLFFFFFFLGVLGMVLQPGAKKKYERIARIPLEEGDHDQ